jgi:hypothetical protein
LGEEGRHREHSRSLEPRPRQKKREREIKKSSIGRVTGMSKRNKLAKSDDSE